MNKFFTITFRISDVYTGTFRYKMYIHVYSHIIAREINVAICIYVHVYQYLHTGTSHRFQSRFYFLDKFELNWTMITIWCLLIYSFAIWGKTVDSWDEACKIMNLPTVFL